MREITPRYTVTHTAKGLLLQGKQGGKTELFLDNISRLVLEGYNIRFDAPVKWAYAYEHKRLTETLASMQGEAPKGFALVPIVTTRAMDDVMREPDWQWIDVLAAAESISEDDYFEPYPPRAAEKIAEQDARIKELESQLVSTDQLSVHDIRIGMSALLQCEVSEIEAMDNRCYDESYQAVQRVIEAISLSVKQEKLFGNEIYQAAANHFEQKINELEQQLEVARKDADRYRLLRDADLTVYGTPRIAVANSEWSGTYMNGDDADSAIDAAIRQIGGAE